MKKAINESGIFHPENVRLMLNAHLNRKAAFGFEIWGLLVFMVSHKSFLKGST